MLLRLLTAYFFFLIKKVTKKIKAGLIRPLSRPPSPAEKGKGCNLLKATKSELLPKMKLAQTSKYSQTLVQLTG